MTGSIPAGGMGAMISWSQLALLIVVIEKIVKSLLIAQTLHKDCTH